MFDVNVYTLEDNNDYNLIDSLIYNNKTYVLLSEVNNTSNICIRKIINNEFNRLENEFDEVYELFLKKNYNLLDRNF